MNLGRYLHLGFLFAVDRFCRMSILRPCSFHVSCNILISEYGPFNPHKTNTNREMFGLLSVISPLFVSTIVFSDKELVSNVAPERYQMSPAMAPHNLIRPPINNNFKSRDDQDHF
jgi:hypothetical protein